MGIAEVFYKKLFPRADFGMSAPGSFFMEKLGEVMLNRLMGKEGDYSIRLIGTDVYDKKYVLDDEDYFSRYYTELESVFMDIIEAGACVLGKATSYLRPYPSACGDFYTEETAREFVESHDLMEVVVAYLPSLSKEDRFALPGLCNDVYETAQDDPCFEECDVGFFMIESPLIGEFLSCDRIPAEIQRKVGKLIRHISDPLDRGYYYYGMTRGVYRIVFVVGCPDCYEWISTNLLSADWLASVLLLKEEILTLDGIFGFLSEETRKGAINGKYSEPSAPEQDEVSRLCA